MMVMIYLSVCFQVFFNTSDLEQIESGYFRNRLDNEKDITKAKKSLLIL